MALNFKDIFESLKEGVSSLAETSLQDFISQAKTDGKNILDSLKSNLKKWTQQLEDGDLSLDDFKFLVLAQKDLIEMVALKQAGVAMIEAVKFKNSVFNLIINTITGLI